jgi:hypothetical protein
VSNPTQPQPTADFVKIWNLLAVAYPNYGKEQGPEAMALTLKLYWRLLADIPLQHLQQAALRHMAASKPRCRPLSAAAIGTACGMKPTDAAAHLCGLMTAGLVSLAARGSGWVLTAKGIDHAETRMVP